METLLTDDILNLMRKIGDPLVDDPVDVLPEEDRKVLIRKARAQGLLTFWDSELRGIAGDLGIAKLLDEDVTLPDPDLIETACNLFARYGSEIAAALLLSALPEAYAAGEGAEVLAQRSELIDGQLTTHRILATAQFVIWVLTPGTPTAPISDDSKFTYPSFDDTTQLWRAPQGQALRASLALRILHSLIRNSAPTGMQGLTANYPSRLPLNQEDLLATLLSFSITVFEVLEQFGIMWTAEEQEAYFYVWDRVGATLGIGDINVICRLTGTGSPRALMSRLHNFDDGYRGPAMEVDGEESATERDEGHENGQPAGIDVTSVDIDELFEGRLNRRVLRHVADLETLRPQSVPEARALLARLRKRMWTLSKDSFPERKEFDYENFKEILDDVSAGRILLKTMLDQVTAQLPASQKRWPIAVIRQLVPAPVQNRLALGGTSSIGFLSGIIGGPRDSPGSVVLRRISAEILRQRATRVADSLFLSYYDKGQLTIPGLRSTALGYGLTDSDRLDLEAID